VGRQAQETGVPLAAHRSVSICEYHRNNAGSEGLRIPGSRYPLKGAGAIKAVKP
jgi:hypothetical protein